MSDTVAAPSEKTTPAEDLRRFLDGEYREIREGVRKRLADEQYAPVPGDIDRDEYRELVMKWMTQLADDGEATILFPREYGGEGNLGGGISAFEMLGHSDLSLLVKCGVHFGLFGGAILHLGDEDQRKEYLPRVMDASLPGCFAMTEAGHGSDVQRLGTTATYHVDGDEFVIHTPDDSARKDYIANSCVHGKMAVVFAQLLVDGDNEGVHALLVPLRGDDGNCLPGIRIEDDGQKLGLNGVDNGQIWFDGVRVPRTALLARYGGVTEKGEYESEFENRNRRFFTTIGTLVQGRVSVAGAALSATKSALTIAIRYALHRRQFGTPGEEGDEMLLLDYRVHQRRLMPLLAKTYALHFAQQELIGELDRVVGRGEGEDRDKRKLEAFAAGVKATSTWHATYTIQTCREACGGAGYMDKNRFAALKADTDVFTTFEGANTILLQLVAKGLLTDYKERFGNLSALEMVRFAGEQAYETTMERTLARQLVTRLVDAVTPNGDDDEGDIEDREYQLRLFEWREEHVLTGVSRRLKRGLDDGRDQFDVFNE